MPAIVITDGLGVRTRVELERDQRYSLGQSEDNDIRLQDHLLSKRHVEIYPEGKDWLLADCGSAMGTYIEGDRLTGPVRLGPGRVIGLGRCELRFEPDRGPRIALKASALDPAGLLKTPVTEIMRESWEGRSTPRGELEAARRRLAIVERAGSDLLAHEPPDILLPRLLDLVFETIRPGRIALIQRQPGGELECRAYRGAGDQEISLGRGLASAVLDERASVLTSEIRGELQAVMAAPLWSEEGVMGMVYADSPMSARRFTYADLKLLTMMGKIAAIQIRNSMLFEEQIEKRLLEKEHRAAAEIQRQLLPSSAPAIPGYAFAGQSIPCNEVGGDYFDCVRLDENRHAIVLGDVAGKGVGAALLMAVLQATFRARVETGPTIQDLARQMNAAITRSTPGNRFITMFLVELDRTTHRTLNINAGLSPPPRVVRSTGELITIPAGGPPLGVFADREYPFYEIELKPGDMLFSCSDGVTGAIDRLGRPFGEDRLTDILSSHAGLGADQLDRALRDRLREFGSGTGINDDLTFVILQRMD